MLKILISCIWVCLVTVGSAYGVIMFKTHEAEARVPTEADKVGYDKTRPINVPMLANGAVQGYVVAQFAYTAMAKEGRQATLPIEAFILDEAFKTLYADEKLDFNHLEKYDLPGLTKGLIGKVNARLNAPLLKDVLVEEFNYISKEDVSR